MQLSCPCGMELEPDTNTGSGRKPLTRLWQNFKRLFNLYMNRNNRICSFRRSFVLQQFNNPLHHREVSRQPAVDAAHTTWVGRTVAIQVKKKQQIAPTLFFLKSCLCADSTSDMQQVSQWAVEVLYLDRGRLPTPPTASSLYSMIS